MTKPKSAAAPDLPGGPPTAEERAQVEAMAVTNIPDEEIALVLREGVPVEALRHHFARELRIGPIKARAAIGRALYQKAVQGDVTAASLFLRLREGAPDAARTGGSKGQSIRNPWTRPAGAGDGEE